jgi:hypothetical protein
MEKKITDNVETLISTKLPDNSQINSFLKANEEYQKLIQEGLTVKRGFNIMTSEEIYNSSLNYQFNQSVGFRTHHDTGI